MKPELTAGCIVRYKYHGEWEYAIWRGDGTRTIIGKPSIPGRVIQCVWKGDKLEPRKEVSI